MEERRKHKYSDIKNVTGLYINPNNKRRKTDNKENKMEHAELVRNLAKKGCEIKNEMTGHDAHLIHMVLGISGESGELLDAIKKHTIYHKPLDIGNVIEELGDIEFYMEGLRQGLGLSRECIIDRNIEKLQVRYGEGTYSDKAANERADKEETPEFSKTS